MFSNYLKTATRNLFRQRGYSLINIMGLSVGLTVSLLILHWTQDETNMNSFHENADLIHRVFANHSDNGNIVTWNAVPYPVLDVLSEKYPEVEDVAGYDATNKKQFVVDNREFLADGLYATDGFFRIFSFPFVEGKRRDIFSTPKSVTISEDLAERLFGKDWQGQVIGESVMINGDEDYMVSGVFKNTPANSSMEFDFVLSLQEQNASRTETWAWGNYNTCVFYQLKPGVDAAQFSAKVTNLIAENNEHAANTEILSQPFPRTYLHNQFENGVEAGGRIEYVRLFSLAALFLLVIACINFMNLATARASKRAKEVGVRKTVGAGRASLIAQFMTEAAVLTAVSIGVAILFGELLMPSFQEISGKELSFDYLHPAFWLLTLGVGVVTALLAGSYPAFFLSSFRVVNVLKGKLSYSFGGGQIRRGLVVFQFVLSALLVLSALVVQKQVDYLRNKHLGLDKENVFYFRTPPGAKDNLETYRSELKRIPGIESITFTNSSPLRVNAETGDVKWEGMAPDDGFLCNILLTDENFLETMKVPLSSGRDFSAEIGNDTVSYLVNETAAKIMKMDEPIGKNLSFWGAGGPIVGVVKDFHIGSLHQSIGPLVLVNSPKNTGLSMMRIDPKRTEDVIAASQSIFAKYAEGYPFRYDFMDDRYLKMYRSEQRTGDLSQWFALVALFISCLGLFGLSAFIAEQKTKEIGVRKVLGATIPNLVAMLSKDFLKLVVFSLLIALPLGWYLMDGWLQDFAYRVNISWWTFAAAAGVAVFVALATVSFQSIKAALSNPVDALRSE